MSELTTECKASGDASQGVDGHLHFHWCIPEFNFYVSFTVPQRHIVKDFRADSEVRNRYLAKELSLA